MATQDDTKTIGAMQQSKLNENSVEGKCEDKSSQENLFFGLSLIQFVEILAGVLCEIADAGNGIPLHQSRQLVTVFHTNKPPQISIKQYLERIVTYAYCSPECFIMALIYLDRIVQRNPKFYISSYNIHRLLITSVMISAKFFDDKYYNNAYYAKVGGVTPKEMNTMELEFLYLVNFKLRVTPESFEQYRNELITNDPIPPVAPPVVPNLTSNTTEERKSEKQQQLKSQQACKAKQPTAAAISSNSPVATAKKARA